MSKNERRVGLSELVASVASIPSGTLNSDLIQELNNCLSAQPVQAAPRPLPTSPMLSMHTGVVDGRINSDLLLAPAMATFGHPGSTRFEHFVFVDESTKMRAPRRVCLTKGSQPASDGVEAGLSGWSPDRSGTRTPKFHEDASYSGTKKFQVKLGNSRLRGGRGTSQKKSPPPNAASRKKLVTKSQATETELHQPRGAKENTTGENYGDDVDTYEQYEVQLEIPVAERVAQPPTIMRATPHSPEDGPNPDVTSE